MNEAIVFATRDMVNDYDVPDESVGLIISTNRRTEVGCVAVGIGSSSIEDAVANLFIAGIDRISIQEIDNNVRKD